MPLRRDSEWITPLREGDSEGFNKMAATRRPELETADLRLVDLRKFNVKNANFRDSYLRNADLRGVDLSQADLEGASLHAAQISGALLPLEIAADEIRLSVEQGTRMRCFRAKAA